MGPLDFLSSAETVAVYEQPSGAARTLLTIARTDQKALLAVADKERPVKQAT